MLPVATHALVLPGDPALLKASPACGQGQTGTAEPSHSLGLPCCARHILAKGEEVVHWQETEPLPREGPETPSARPAEPRAGGGPWSHTPSDPRLSRSTLRPFAAGKVREGFQSAMCVPPDPWVCFWGTCLPHRFDWRGASAYSCCPFGFFLLHFSSFTFCP